MFDVITIGSVTRDNFLESDFPIINDSGAPSGKAIALPFGEKLEVKKVYSTIGGNSANASVTFARQDLRTACFGKVGEDLAGREIAERLKKEKVQSLFSKSKEKSTAYSVLLLEKGERTILGHHGASDTLIKEDIPWSKLKASWWYLSLAGESDKLLGILLAFARKNKIKVAFNPSGHHIQHKRKEILAHLKDLAFLVLNAGEAADLVGIPFNKEKEVFKKLDKLTPGIVAVTDGPNGVTVSDGKYLYKAGIFKERRVADRTGAGDSFGSGFVAGLMSRADKPNRTDKSDRTDRTYSSEAIKYAIRLASANATSVVEHIGATEGILTKREFENPRWHKFKIEIKKL
ncbi:MAG: carbohydrate kinase family protein [Candidatus Harrisonbacteria bacterium]|nr:carbohydrate kinase family protein [Candidatus Harrisonbacteria bacterium]